MRTSYIICSSICELFLVIAMIAIPIWITPDWYFWSVLMFVFGCSNGYALSTRIDQWNAIDRDKADAN